MRFVRKDGIAHASSEKSYDLPSTGVLDFDELQEFPTNSSLSTKSDFICDHIIWEPKTIKKTLYEP